MKGRKLEFNKKHSNRFLMSTGSPFSRLYLKYRQYSTEVPVLTLEEMRILTRISDSVAKGSKMSRYFWSLISWANPCLQFLSQNSMFSSNISQLS